MLYDAMKSVVLRVFRAPGDPPAAPTGTHTSVRVMRASPRYLMYRLLGVASLALLVSVAILVTALAALAESKLWLATAFLVVTAVPVVLVQYFIARVDYDLRYYLITDRSVRVRQGAWIVDEKTITFANVQNVRLEQGPVERLLGFANVRIDTAGGGVAAGAHGDGGAHGVVLAGIEDAAAVRDLVLAQVRQRTDAGLGDRDDRSAPAALGGGHGWSADQREALRLLAEAAIALRASAQRTLPPPGPERPPLLHDAS